MAGFCETITSSASAKAEIEARAELGKNTTLKQYTLYILYNIRIRIEATLFLIL